MNPPVPSLATLVLELERAEVVFDVQSYHVSEGVSVPFHVSLVVMSTDPNIDFESIVGFGATFSIDPGTPGARRWAGVCREIAQVSTADSEGVTTYALSLSPFLWLLSQRRNYRAFQGMTPPAMACAILDEWEIPYEIRYEPSDYRRCDYVAQYGESDYNFFARTLERCGISYVVADDGTVLLSSRPASAEPRRSIPFLADSGMVQRGDHVFDVVLGRQVRPGVYTMADHDPHRPPGYQVTSQATIGGESMEAKLERYHYRPGVFLVETEQGAPLAAADDRGHYRHDANHGRTLAAQRLAAKRVGARSIALSTNARDLTPGTVFAIVGHPHDWLADERRLMVTECTIQGLVDAGPRIEVAVVDAESPFFPALVSPKPSTKGVDTATVVGPEGQEIHCNELGQVRVQFHWDRRGNMDEKSSAWVHLCSSWAGGGFGALQLPRVGDEVVVDYLGGDPDQPIVVGRVFTGVNQGPYSLPAHKSRSGVRTMSTPGGGGYNELMFEDAAGHEMLALRAQKDMRTTVLADDTVRVGGTRRLAVGDGLTANVGGASTEVIGTTKTIAAGAGIQMSSAGASLNLAADGSLVIDAARVVFNCADVSVAGTLFGRVEPPKGGE